MNTHQQQQQEQEQEQEQSTIQQQNKTHMLILKIMSKRRTWVSLFVLVYTIILYFSLNLLQSILNWYNTTLSPPASPPIGGWVAAVYASVMLGAVFGVMSMTAAFAVAVPAMVVTWITILVLLAFFGKGRRDLVVQGKKLTGEIVGLVVRVLIREGNFVAAVCAVLGYFFLVRKNTNAVDDF